MFLIYDWINNTINTKWIDEIMFSQLINNIEPILFELKNDINSWVFYFDKIKNIEDEKINKLFFSKKEDLLNLKNIVNIIYDNKEIIKSILWNDKKRTYLLVFQNADEIRPTWWFMWSVWFLDIFMWKITKFEKKDIYAVEWDLKPFLEPAPEWINHISKTFWLRDANYFINNKDSSDKIKSFVDRTKYKIDAILYINQNVILDALKKYGWVYFEQVKMEVNHLNFSMLTSTLVEAKISKTHTLATPKQVLFDFMERYFETFKDKWDYIWYMNLFLDSIEKKDIIFYSFNEEENKFLNYLWFDKSPKYNDFIDFNYPIFTSISGNKSDRYIERFFEKQISYNSDCSINSSLIIKQKHGFNINEEIKIKNFLYDMDLLGKVDIVKTLDIQWKWLNKQFVRLLIPKNSIVWENSKIKVNDLDNAKEVSFYLDTNTFFPSKFKIDYTIPNSNCLEYWFLFVKQPWIKKYDLNIYKDWNNISTVSTSTDKDYILYPNPSHLPKGKGE